MTVHTSGYVEALEDWRREVETSLRSDWVSLVGRFELEPGVSRIGANPAYEVTLPASSAPDTVGELRFEAGEVNLTVAPHVAVLVNGAPVTGVVSLRSDLDGAPDIVTLNTLTFFIIQRGPRTIVRVRDSASPELQRFGGRRWLPIDESYRVEGVFTPYDPPKQLAITNILGDTSGQTSPGFVTFTLDGHEHQLDATGWRNGGLVLHFNDATNRDITYGGGRSLVTTPPTGQFVTLDFNRTSNLPCAFTPFATCPIPPQQNRLTIRIEAGELRPDAEY